MQDIVISHLYKSFGDKAVISDLSAVFPKNEISCIMAVSGAGKTTLVRIIMGLEKADSGMVTGTENAKIRAVFQENRLCGELDAVSNIRLVNDKNTKQDVIKALNEMGIIDCTEKPVSSFSGGMKRRVAILRALLSDFDILILDEALQGLDSDTNSLVLENMKKYIAQKTVIMITHNKQDAEFFGCKNYINF